MMFNIHNQIAILRIGLEYSDRDYRGLSKFNTTFFDLTMSTASVASAKSYESWYKTMSTTLVATAHQPYRIATCPHTTYIPKQK